MASATHKAELDEDEIEQREGFRVTSPLRTLLDVAASETVTQEQLNQIVEQALMEGIVRSKKLEKAIACQTGHTRLSEALALAG